MSGIYILGMGMPKDRSRWVVIYPDGKVDYSDKTDEWETLDKGAIPVPKHGRLKDADALWVEINKICDRRDAEIISDLTCLNQILSAIRHAPTIIPADNEELPTAPHWDVHTEDDVTRLLSLPDVRPAKPGKWNIRPENLVWNSYGIYSAAYQCSNCDAAYPFDSNYCPNCGAKMKAGT